MRPTRDRTSDDRPVRILATCSLRQAIRAIFGRNVDHVDELGWPAPAPRFR